MLATKEIFSNFLLFVYPLILSLLSFAIPSSRLKSVSSLISRATTSVKKQASSRIYSPCRHSRRLASYLGRPANNCLLTSPSQRPVMTLPVLTFILRWLDPGFDLILSWPYPVIISSCLNLVSPDFILSSVSAVHFPSAFSCFLSDNIFFILVSQTLFLSIMFVYLPVCLLFCLKVMRTHAPRPAAAATASSHPEVATLSCRSHNCDADSGSELSRLASR